MRALIGWMFKILAGLICLLVIFLVVVTIFKIPVNLTRFKEPIETISSELLQRPVAIEKSIVLSTSLSPVFTLEGLRVDNPEGFSEDSFMYLGLARIQVELLPLLKKKLHIAEFSVHKFTLNLEETADGAINWVVGVGDGSGAKAGSAAPKPAYEPGPGQAEPSFQAVSDTIVVKKLMLKDIHVELRTPNQPEPHFFGITSCEGAMLPGEPLRLDIDGKLLEFPYSIDVQIASLDEFLLHDRSWMDIKMNIAETDLSFSGDIDLVQANRSLSLQAAVSGNNLNSLNDLLLLDLPPLQKYAVEAALLAKDNHLELENLLVKTGMSSLEGAAKITRSGEHYNARLSLEAPLVQLNDFIFEDWSLTGSSGSEEMSKSEPPAEDRKADANTSPEAETTEQKGGNRKLVDPELLATIDAAITITAAEVLSGEDKLGSGLLQATLQDGRIAIEPLELSIPGGSIRITSSLKPGTEQSDATLTAVIDNFDIGILVRRTKPDSDMGGLVNLDVDLTSSAATIDQLLANGNGYFDFSGQLSNMKAGIVDLWAVNLVAAIVSSTDENESQINCAVGRWSVEDGVLSPDVFVIDTSKIRICGEGQVNFKDQTLDLSVAPHAKRAEFFSLATPLGVTGSFDDIGFGIEGGGLLGTAVRFVASPITTPIKRVILDKIPEDGSDICSVPLGMGDRSEIIVDGCD